MQPRMTVNMGSVVWHNGKPLAIVLGVFKLLVFKVVILSN